MHLRSNGQFLKLVTLGHAPPLQEIAIIIDTNGDCKLHIYLVL